MCSYNSISSVCFRYLACVHLDSGDNVVQSQPAISCDDTSYKSALGPVVILLVLVSIGELRAGWLGQLIDYTLLAGLPTAMGALLWWSRRTKDPVRGVTRWETPEFKHRCCVRDQV